MGQFSVTFPIAAGSVLSDIQHPRALSGPSWVWSSGSSLGSGWLSQSDPTEKPDDRLSYTTPRDMTDATADIRLARLILSGCQPEVRSDITRPS